MRGKKEVVLPLSIRRVVGLESGAVQWLRELAALREAQVWLQHPYHGPTSICNSTCRGSITLFRPQRAHITHKSNFKLK